MKFISSFLKRKNLYDFNVDTDFLKNKSNLLINGNLLFPKYHINKEITKIQKIVFNENNRNDLIEILDEFYIEEDIINDKKIIDEIDNRLKKIDVKEFLLNDFKFFLENNKILFKSINLNNGLKNKPIIDFNKTYFVSEDNLYDKYIKLVLINFFDDYYFEIVKVSKEILTSVNLILESSKISNTDLVKHAEIKYSLLILMLERTDLYELEDYFKLLKEFEDYNKLLEEINSPLPVSPLKLNDLSKTLKFYKRKYILDNIFPSGTLQYNHLDSFSNSEKTFLDYIFDDFNDLDLKIYYLICLEDSRKELFVKLLSTITNQISFGEYEDDGYELNFIQSDRISIYKSLLGIFKDLILELDKKDLIKTLNTEHNKINQRILNLTKNERTKRR